MFDTLGSSQTIAECETEDDCASSAAGILGCLRMLANEAAELRLHRTAAALLGAIATCAREYGIPAEAGRLPH